jgi:hypothetical protein
LATRFAGLVGVLLTGCATICPPPSTSSGASGLSAERLMLSEGYSILRHDAETLTRTKLILYTKSETGEFDELITAVSAFGSKLRDDLVRIDRDYPGVRVDLDPLPELEKRKRFATGFDKVVDFAPVVGKSGREYERTVLISVANGLNQERHLVLELTKAETDAGLKDFLRGVQTKMDVLYERAENLLRKRHYRDVSSQ